MAAGIADAPQARADDAVSRFVTQTRAAFVALMRSPASRHEAGCTAMHRDVFDFTAIAKAATSQKWPVLNAEQKRALDNALEARLRAECLRLLAEPDRGEPLIRRQRDLNGAVRVTVQHIDGEEQATTVSWTLVPGGKYGMRAIDATDRGRGLVATLRGDFFGQLAGHGGDIDMAIRGLSNTR